MRTVLTDIVDLGPPAWKTHVIRLIRRQRVGGRTFFVEKGMHDDEDDDVVCGNSQGIIALKWGARYTLAT